MLVAGKPQQINFDVEGRGRFSYSAVLSGFVPADKLKSTTALWRATRTYEPAQRMLDGQSIPRGFNVLAGGYSTFRNPLTQLPMGERGEVTLHIYRTNARGTKDEQLDYLVVTEPIPAGTMVLTESIKGSFERYEIQPGAITFYIGDRTHPGNIHYTLVGYVPGAYRTVPTIVRSFYQPDLLVVTEPKPLEVLQRGAKSKDAYKLTPVELHEFGKRLAAKGDHAEASRYLTELFKDYRLKEGIHKEVAQLLFRASLAAGESSEIVDYFEIVKEKYPDVEIDFPSILKVGLAYRDMGEYERSYLVFRATTEASFERESQVAGFLDEQGEFLRSVDVVERLLREYPAEPYIAMATYALAQEVYGKAQEAAADKRLRDSDVSRVDLIAASIRMVDHFLSTWPNDPAADQAAFSLVNSLLDLEQYDASIDRSQKSAKRYPNSELLDSFWYMIGYSQFALGKHEAALDMCRKVSEAIRKDPGTGVLVPAANKWQAIYIMGQVYHSLGQAAQAITEYERVKERFSDAAQAIGFFARKQITLPEVTTVRPGKECAVPLTFRNVAGADLKVYRIDLMKFGLMQRNLDRITAINLAGIRPYHQQDLELGDGRDYRDRQQSLKLPLQEEGAYLVVCRGENIHCSGLVLVSPLDVEVQEDATSGRVRVTVKDVAADRYRRDVDVKVIGSNNDQFISGESDLRGVFVADGIRGTSTVIAKTDEDLYAFYRGELTLGPAPDPAGGKPAAADAPAEQQAAPAPADALRENLMRQNEAFNMDQRSNYRNLLENKRQGVKAKAAF